LEAGQPTKAATVAAVIVSDNGSELTSAAVLRWSTGRFDWHYIAPGKPVQNACQRRLNPDSLSSRSTK